MSMSLTFGPPGSDLRIKASGFDVGQAVDIYFGALLMRTAHATPDTGTALGIPSGLAALRPDVLLGRVFGGARPQAATVGAIDETLAVPDVSPGLYDVCVASDGNETACGTFRVTAKPSVLGVQFSRGTSGGSGGVQVLGRTFARTGINVAILAFAGVSLILLGRSLRAGSRRRRVRA
jgi:hypothetical protein